MPLPSKQIADSGDRDMAIIAGHRGACIIDTTELDLMIKATAMLLIWGETIIQASNGG